MQQAGIQVYLDLWNCWKAREFSSENEPQQAVDMTQAKSCHRIRLVAAAVNPKELCLADKLNPCPCAPEWQGRWASAYNRPECICGIVLLI